MAASLSGRLFAAGAHSRAWGPVHRLQNVKKNVIELASGSYQHPSGQYVKNRYSNTTAES